MNTLKKLIVLLIIINPLSSFSQYGELIDSLIINIRTTPDDTTKVDNLNLICKKLSTFDFDASVKYGEFALDLAQKIYYKEGGALANKNLGTAYYYQADYTNAHYFYSESLKIYKELNDTKGTAILIRNLGSIYSQQGEYEKALKYFFESLELRLKIDDKKGIASLNNAIGLIYLEQGEDSFDKAIEYFNKSRKMYEVLENKRGIAKSYFLMGNVYSKYSKPKTEEALKYFQNYLNISTELGNARMIAEANDALGAAYLETKEIDKAYTHIKKAINVFNETGSLFGLANAYFNMGSYYLIKKDSKNAEKYLLKSIKITQQINVPSIEKENSRKLAEIYRITNKPEKALEYFANYVALKDSLQNLETSKEIARLEMKNEFNKKMKQVELEQQKKDLLAEANLKRQKLYTIGFIIALILMVGIVIVTLRSFKIKQKANKLLHEKNDEITHQNQELQQQKEEIETQKEEIETQKEEVEIQRDIAIKHRKEIVDSINYAQRIQEAVLPPPELAKKLLSDHFILFKPRDIVSGDFYWMKKIKNFTILAVADCTGHGVPGAFMSMLGSSFLNEIVSVRSLDSSGEILNALRNKVKKSLRQDGKEGEQKDGMDIALCIFDNETNELQFSGAYNPLYILRKQNEIDGYKLTHVKADRQPIGIHIIEKDFTTKKVQLKKDDIIYAFSDGYADQFGGKDGGKLKTKKFKELIVSISDKPMKKQKVALEHFFDKWRGDNEQLDDVLVIGMKI